MGDPVAFIDAPEASPARTLILRDIEMDRARRDASVDAVFCPADFAPESGLSGDRETATENTDNHDLAATPLAKRTPFV